jgi:hypothetical protein
MHSGTPWPQTSQTSEIHILYEMHCFRFPAGSVPKYFNSFWHKPLFSMSGTDLWEVKNYWLREDTVITNELRATNCPEIGVRRFFRECCRIENKAMILDQVVGKVERSPIVSHASEHARPEGTEQRARRQICREGQVGNQYPHP